MLIPITFPDNSSKLIGSIHDPNLSLRNPEPKLDWKVGDAAWIYARSNRSAVSGPIVFIDDHEENAGLDYVWCGIADSTAESAEADTFITTCSRLFPSLEALTKALFSGYVPSVGENSEKKSEEVPAKGVAWFDFDGTLCAPVFQDGGKTQIGFQREKFGEFCERKRGDAYNDCIPMEPVIQYARELHKAGYRLGVLSCASNGGEAIAKCAWMSKWGLDGLFEQAIFLDNPSEKTAFMVEQAARDGFRPDQVVLVEDSYENLISALSAGIIGVHISHILTGAICIPF